MVAPAAASETTRLVEETKGRRRWRTWALGAAFGGALVAVPLVATRRAGAVAGAGALYASADPRGAIETTLSSMCGIFSDPRVDWSGCNDFEEAAAYVPSLFALEVNKYAAAGLDSAIAMCAPSEKTAFDWLRPCEWQFVADMPSTCAKTLAPTPPELPESLPSRTFSPNSDAVCTQLTGAYVDPDGCTPCQANAFCLSCGADNKYCNAYLAAHPGLLRSQTDVGTAEAFFVDDELNYWCSDAVQAAIEAGSYDPREAYDVPDGAGLYLGDDLPEAGSASGRKK